MRINSDFSFKLISDAIFVVKREEYTEIKSAHPNSLNTTSFKIFRINFQLLSSTILMQLIN